MQHQIQIKTWHKATTHKQGVQWLFIFDQTIKLSSENELNVILIFIENFSKM
jgi:hypothetical protein